MRIRLVVAGSNLNAHIVTRATTKVAGAADVARETVGIGAALRCCGGSEDHGGHDGRLEEKAEHFGSCVKDVGCFVDECEDGC